MKIDVGTLVTRPSLIRPQANRHGIVRGIQGRYAVVKFWGTHIHQKVLLSRLVVMER